MNPTILTALRALPHFQSLDPALVEEIAAGCRLLELSSGEVIFREEEPARAFYVIAEGGVRVYRLGPDGRQQVLHHLRAGHSFAEAALLSLHQFPASAEATQTPTRVVEVPGERFLRIFRRDEAVAGAMFGSLCAWLLRLVGRIDELTVLSAGARLAHYLIQLPGRSTPEGVTLDLPLSKKDLAAYLSITPETLSRLLRRWRDRGVCRSEGRQVVVLRADVLEAIADGVD